MEAYASDWLQLVIRWVHLITGIAWIGASFYFVWLDNHLQPPQDEADTDRGIGGELWAVHGGGFYVVRKFRVAPKDVKLDSPERVVVNAQKIYEQAVATRAMPIGNLTRMTDEERATLAAWIAAGGRAR